mmetsp:Transcript_81701/g.142115  ORF Transcript_81701/g.142115 Transcript_81701/m.142115 type:complete len:197 (+) Transcript_81701:85-675(+)
MAMCTKPEVDTKELEIGMCAKPEVYRFPEGGAPSRVLGTTYQNPRFLYLTEWLLWTSVAVGRYLLCLFDLRLLVMWGLMDTCLMFMNAAGVLFKNIRFHHCQRYLNITPKTDAKEITHVLAILHYKEPAEQLYDLVEQLAEQPAQGKKSDHDRNGRVHTRPNREDAEDSRDSWKSMFGDHDYRAFLAAGGDSRNRE